jgi:hypothetical protein
MTGKRSCVRKKEKETNISWRKLQYDFEDKDVFHGKIMH